MEELAVNMSLVKRLSTSGKRNTAGMSVSEMKRLKELEEGNRRLKKMYANLSLEHEALKNWKVEYLFARFQAIATFCLI